MRKPLIVIIVTLSLVCTLKGMCQYTVQRIKVMHVCVKMMSKGSKEALTVLIVTHVTQVKRVESGVCSFYTTLHTELLNLLLMSKGSKVYSVYSGLSPLPGGKAIVWAFCLGGLAVHHWSVWGGSFVKFLGLVNYKGDCRQDTQPIPNSKN